jgi:hypothetical protein
LDDANNAGGKQSEKCTLILTEGDSAKALAISGLSVVGRDNYGVFPLRGKLLNVRDATSTQVLSSFMHLSPDYPPVVPYKHQLSCTHRTPLVHILSGVSLFARHRFSSGVTVSMFLAPKECATP